MSDEDGKEGQDFSAFARERQQEESRGSTGGRILRGCGIALGIGFLVLLFGVGACFMAWR